MDELTKNQILATLFLVYAIWNYMIYFAIDYNWDVFIGWHWFVGGMMFLLAGSTFIAFIFSEKKKQNQRGAR